ncbi:collagen-like protein [Vitiosangium sp. GDMCC 1.1324]|uniref:collagen-like protein n=1 Tax=Vitiosangium sp. (strain GDMCC 1.1324) TaxID=2138576 RepID=UPI00130E4AED|nr:collagen-like protein [Vitiosangium sp. GDMCC 1.1324]
MCTPGASFCEGSKLWACTKTGTDAVLTTECTGGSTTNPVGCFTTQCLPGSPGCCRTTKPTCRWNLTNPAMSGSYFLYDPEQPYCTVTSQCAEDNAFALQLRPDAGGVVCPKPTYYQISLSLKRPMTTPGEVISLPNSRVYLSLSSYDSTKSCSTWTGTVTWNSDVPSWSVTFDATCSETGKSSIRFTGTFSGDL